VWPGGAVEGAGDEAQVLQVAFREVGGDVGFELERELARGELANG